eukprot:Em0024g92a
MALISTTCVNLDALVNHDTGEVHLSAELLVEQALSVVVPGACSLSGCPRCWLYQWLSLVLALSVVVPGAGSISGCPSIQMMRAKHEHTLSCSNQSRHTTVHVIREAQRQSPVIKLVAQALQKSEAVLTQGILYVLLIELMVLKTASPPQMWWEVTLFIPGKLCFLVLRQQYHTIQAVVAVGDKVSKQMVKFAADVHLESIVDVEGTIASTSERILGCSHQTVELRVTKVFVVSQAAAQLPLQIEDAMRPDNSEQESYC